MCVEGLICYHNLGFGLHLVGFGLAWAVDIWKADGNLS